MISFLESYICESPSAIQNGEARHLTGLKQGDTYELHCKGGYRVAVEKPEDLNDTHTNDSFNARFNDGQALKQQWKINCTKTGQWSNIPRCEPVSCGTPAVPGHAYITYVKGFTYKSAVVFCCRKGFEMVGKPFIVCQGNGTWSESPYCGKVGEFMYYFNISKLPYACLNVFREKN